MFAPAATLQLTREERAEIDHLVANGSTPQKLARRARIIALAADGTPNRQIATLVGVSRPTVIAQRRRFQEMGLSGLVKDRTRRSGRRPALPAATVKKIVDATRSNTSQCHSMDHSLDGGVGRCVARRGPSNLGAAWAAAASSRDL